MNINRFLSPLINEGVAVEKMNKVVEGKVPQRFLDELSSKMKETRVGKFYDDEAKAIINRATEEEKDEYLLNHPGTVYSILKKLKKGSSSFNVKEVLSNGSGKEYWKEMYSQANKEKEELLDKEKEYNETGLKTARVFSVDEEWFAIFPKRFSDKDNGRVLGGANSNKGWEDLRRISAEIASKDKETPENHWCVASSDISYYKHYMKERFGIFIIFVGKKPNGSPDWGRRYLWYTDGSFDEFASKNNRHLKIEYVLSDKCLSLINKQKEIITNKVKTAKPIVDDIIQKARKKAQKDINSGNFKIKHVNYKSFSLGSEFVNKTRGEGEGSVITPEEQKNIVKKNLKFLLNDNATTDFLNTHSRTDGNFDYVFSSNWKEGVIIDRDLSEFVIYKFSTKPSVQPDRLYDFLSIAKSLDNSIVIKPKTNKFSSIKGIVKSIVLGNEVTNAEILKNDAEQMWRVRKAGQVEVDSKNVKIKHKFNLGNVAQNIFDKEYFGEIAKGYNDKQKNKYASYVNKETGIIIKIINTPVLITYDKKNNSLENSYCGGVMVKVYSKSGARELYNMVIIDDKDLKAAKSAIEKIVETEKIKIQKAEEKKRLKAEQAK